MKHPTICQLEYLTPDGTWQALATHALLYPERYPERLSAAGKVGRAVEVRGRGRVWTSDNVPDDPAVLVPTTEGGPVPYRLPRPDDRCQHCRGVHGPPHDGGCLI